MEHLIILLMRRYTQLGGMPKHNMANLCVCCLFPIAVCSRVRRLSIVFLKLHVCVVRMAGLVFAFLFASGFLFQNRGQIAAIIEGGPCKR